METLENFTQRLTSGADEPLSRFRVLFTWIATNVAYDVEAFRCGRHTPRHTDSGYNALRRRMATCSGYSDLLYRMCSLCDIDCVKIRGYAKGAGYVPGQQFSPGRPNHEWNAVHLEGRWRLVDVCWSSGYVHQATGKFVFNLADHYFLSEPALFAADHLPTDPAWQLLPDPLTLEEFQAAVHFKPAFFRHCLRLLSANTGVISVRRTASVALAFPSPLSLTYELRHLDSSCGITGDGVAGGGEGECSKCVDFRIDDTSAEFRIRPPVPGRYTFRLYGKARGCRGEPAALTTHTLEVTTPSPNQLPWRDLRFPWGPTRHLEELGLQEVGVSCSCLPPGGSGYKVAFTCAHAGVYLRPVLYQLVNEKLRRCATEQTEVERRGNDGGTGRQAVIEASPPSPGHYWLAVYAGDEPGTLKDRSEPGVCVANYLICTAKADKSSRIGDVVSEKPASWHHECWGLDYDERELHLSDGSASPSAAPLALQAALPALSRQIDLSSVLGYPLFGLASFLGQMCAKLKYHSHRSCVRFLRYIID